MIEWYVHHGRNVAVRHDLKGKHQKMCLCWTPCSNFKPNTPQNCPKAQRNFEMDKAEGMTTPVFECSAFDQESLTIKLKWWQKIIGVRKGSLRCPKCHGKLRDVPSPWEYVWKCDVCNKLVFEEAR